MAESSPYDILGVPKDADQKTIRSAFRRKAKVAHPDTGGSPEAFAQISRALAILSNPTSRERLDRTGEAEPEGPDNEHIEINNMVLQAVLHAIASGDVRFSDIIRSARDHVDEKTLEVDQQIAKQRAACQESVDRVETAIKRLKRRKTDGVDMLAEMLAGTIGNYRMVLEKNLEQLEPQLRKLRAAREILAGYSYRADPRDQPQQGQWAGLQDLMRQQAGPSFFGR